MMQVAAILAGLLTLVILLDLRRRSADRHLTEMRHIEASQELFASHQAFLTEFLESSAPSTMKALLIGLSDVVDDRTSIMAIANSLMSLRPISPAEDAPDFEDEIASFQRDNPRLMEIFTSALINGVMAGVLRWPETASKYEQVSARWFADPKRDVTMAASLSRFRHPDGDRDRVVPTAHAMA